VGERPQGKAEIAGLLERYGLAVHRKLGQHFLADPNVVRRIVAFAGVGPGDRVVEIGAGTGTLTKALAGAGATVVAYEVDERLEPLLAAEVGAVAELRFEDAARVDLERSLAGSPWTMVANLPYQVGTSVLLDAVTGAGRIDHFVVMVQREVADRLVAPSGSKTYGLPSVVAGLFCDVTFGFAVGPQVFFPRPKVDSAVVRLRRLAPPEPMRLLAVDLAAAAFGQRRKMLRSSLRSVLDDPEATLDLAGLDPTARPEDLAPERFLELANAI
jgi:16S rRNA (adenine1518-N6/adenine1519-N6)-dimethyltransferase